MLGQAPKDNRLFVDAVLYRYRAGIPWRDILADYGHWKVIHTRFSHKRAKWA
ncbi:transposase [Mycoavidus sp. B2-EB]|nr:transposase [Mycoavidus sp. B2-EB]